MGFFDRIVETGGRAIASWGTNKSGDDIPPFRSGPGYAGAPLDLVDDVARSIGKSADEVTSDDIDTYIENESNELGSTRYMYSDCDECGVLAWVGYCPECHRVDD